MERITAARERLWREPSGPWSLPPRPSSPPRSHRPGPVSCQSVQTPSEGQRGPWRGLHCPAQVALRQVPSAHRGRAELRSSHGSERFLPGSRGTLHGDNTPLNTSGARTLGFPLSSVFPSAGPRSGRAQPGGGGSHGPRGSALGSCREHRAGSWPGEAGRRPALGGGAPGPTANLGDATVVWVPSPGLPLPSSVPLDFPSQM